MAFNMDVKSDLSQSSFLYLSSLNCTSTEGVTAIQTYIYLQLHLDICQLRILAPLDALSYHDLKGLIGHFTRPILGWEFTKEIYFIHNLFCNNGLHRLPVLILNSVYAAENNAVISFLSYLFSLLRQLRRACIKVFEALCHVSSPWKTNLGSISSGIRHLMSALN